MRNYTNHPLPGMVLHGALESCKASPARSTRRLD